MLLQVIPNLYEDNDIHRPLMVANSISTIIRCSLALVVHGEMKREESYMDVKREKDTLK